LQAGAHTGARRDCYATPNCGCFRALSRRGGPALLQLKLDPQALTMNATLDALREQGVAARNV
jgi:hypothetical protein